MRSSCSTATSSGAPGSNIYNASLARALVALGHEVHLLCQERQARELDFVDAVGTFEDGRLEVETLREPVRLTAYLPDIHGVLPVYVADRYEGFEAVPYPDLDDARLERYLAANVAAVEQVAARVDPDVALANHMVMGPVILARGLAGRVPYAVKIHGSALEYTVRPHRERFLPYAIEGLDGARGVLVGSRHTAESLWEVTGDPSLRERTRLGTARSGRAQLPAGRGRGGARAARAARRPDRGANGRPGAGRRALPRRSARSTPRATGS